MDFLKTKSESTEIIEERITKVNGDFFIKKYAKGSLLGKGGFAKVYNFTNLETNKLLAGKIMPKVNLNRSRSRQKLMVEIKLHQSLHHPNIVKFEHVFEDQDNVYILLELCQNKSMSELLKKRKRLTEFEVQCYLIQMVDALKYIHANRIIHRDLKLGNMFLSDKMQIKFGDFGLAAKLEFDGEKKRTVCGTPNYIAPEILDGNIGHSYQVDIWSLGVVIYTLLYGRPPFETTDIKLTYKKIQETSYSFPNNVSVSESAKDLITKILVKQAEKRLTLDEILLHPFINNSGPVPKSMPVSTLTSAPSSTYVKQFAPSSTSQRIRITTDPDQPDDILKSPRWDVLNSARTAASNMLKSPSNNDPFITEFFKQTPKTSTTNFLGPKFTIPQANTHEQTNYLIIMSPKNEKPTNIGFPTDEIKKGKDDTKKVEPEKKKVEVELQIREETSLLVGIRILQSYDYSSKYGLGYALSNGAVGVSFNDGIKLISLPNNKFNYIVRSPINKQDVITTYDFENYPQDIHKRVLVYNHFKEHFASTLYQIKETGPFVYIKKWISTKQGLIYRMNNRVLQVNFKDETSLILNYETKMLNYVDAANTIYLYELESASSSGNRELTKRLKYTEEVLKHIWTAQTESGKSGLESARRVETEP